MVYVGDDDDDKVLTGDVIAEDARRDDVATGAEQPFQVGLEDIIILMIENTREKIRKICILQNT